MGSFSELERQKIPGTERLDMKEGERKRKGREEKSKRERERERRRRRRKVKGRDYESHQSEHRLSE